MIIQNPDMLSLLARECLSADGTGYSALTSTGAGTKESATRLGELTADNVLVRPPKSIDGAACTVAALWISHGFLDQPHEIVQRVNESIGSYWHGVIHRRERDFSNAKYWFSRAGEMPIDNTLTIKVDDHLRSLPADKSIFRLTANGWSPSSFVDLVSTVADHPEDPRHAIAVAVQQVEWQVMFEHCVRLAAGG